MVQTADENLNYKKSNELKFNLIKNRKQTNIQVTKSICCKQNKFENSCFHKSSFACKREMFENTISLA
jgi:hypothetical protein